jgi:hypothetical protein
MPLTSRNQAEAEVTAPTPAPLPRDVRSEKALMNRLGHGTTLSEVMGKGKCQESKGPGTDRVQLH